MTYSPTTWVNNSTPAISADNLNKIETGLEYIHGVATVAALRLEPAPTSVTTIRTLGCLSAGDGGGGLWRWDASSTDSDDIGITVLPTGHVGAGRWKRILSDNRINVKWFGAVADYSGGTGTSASSAIKAAVNYAVQTADNGLIVYIPSGDYLIDETDLFSSWSNGSDVVYGLTVLGEGQRSTRLYLVNNSADDYYFYDNYASATTSTHDMLNCSFRDFYIEGVQNSTGACNFFRIHGIAGTPTQSLFFDSIYSEDCGIFLTSSGLVNADSIRITNCSLKRGKHVIHNTNIQSVVFWVDQTNAELYDDSIFYFEKGGSLLVQSGSFIISGSAASAYLLEVNNTDVSGISANFYFHGIRTEMRDTNAKLLRVEGINTSSDVIFDSCNLSTRTGGAVSDSIKIRCNLQVQVYFDKCQFPIGGPNLDRLYWSESTVLNFWATSSNFAKCVFTDCTNINSSAITWQGSAGYNLGLTSFRSCDCPDGDYTFSGISYGNLKGTFIDLKTLQCYIGFYPRTAVPTVQLLPALPTGALIKSIRIFKQAGSGSASNYQLIVKDSAGTQVPVGAWATGATTSTIAAQTAVHFVNADNLWVLHGTDTAAGALTLEDTQGLAANAVGFTDGDVALVEYY